MKVSEIIEKYRKAINKVYTHEELERIVEENPECGYAIINLIPLLNFQPERSKREDHHPKGWIRKDDGCGALSSMET